MDLKDILTIEEANNLVNQKKIQNDAKLLTGTSYANAKANNDAAMILFHESVNNSHLLFPTTVLASFSCELFLKTILLSKNIKSNSHSLLDLYNQQSEDIKNKIITKANGMSKQEFERLLEENKNAFVDTRYINEKYALYMNPDFLIKFAQLLENIICESGIIEI